MIRIQAFSYAGGPPEGYACQVCQQTNVKLWREYNAFLSHQRLLCRKCATKDQAESIADSAKLFARIRSTEPPSDVIGWLVPAVPTEEGDTFWGYTSIPPAGVAWWRRLPEQGEDACDK